LADELGERLRARGLTLAAAESFTAGGVCAAVAAAAGASDYFLEGLVCYRDEVKAGRLGVSFETLRTHTAVSAETAAEMVGGIQALSGAALCVATTGYAGRDGAPRPEDGLFYIATALNGDVKVGRYVVSGTRREVTEAGVLQALSALLERLT
jgi:PncC family amidohydrolase